MFRELVVDLTETGAGLRHRLESGWRDLPDLEGPSGKPFPHEATTRQEEGLAPGRGDEDSGREES